MDRTLILPRSTLQAPAPPPMFAQFLTYSNITGTPSTFADLMHLLGTLRRSDVVRWTSTLIEVVSRNEGCSPDSQAGLIRDLLDPDLAKKVLETAAKEPNCVIFHRRQFWLLLQLSSIASNEATEPGDDASVCHAIGRASLMASDCLAKIQDANKLIDEDPENGLGWLVTVMLSHVDSNVTNEVIARAQLFWFESLADPKVKRELERLEIGDNFDSVFKQNYGLTLQEFFFVAVSLYFAFLAPAVKPKAEPALVDATVGAGGLFSEEDKKRVLDALSLNISDMPAFLFGKPRQSWATDFSPLHAHPLIEVFPNRYTCPDLSFYRLFFVDGIYWMITEAMGKKNWGNLYAAIYEWYINQLIGCFTVTSDILVRTFYPGRKFQGLNHEICDGLILWENTAVLCEYKGTRLTSRARSGVAISETIAGIQKMSGSEDCGVGQLAKSIGLALAGNRIASGNDLLDLRQYKAVIPMLIWQEEAAVNHAVRHHLQDLLAEFLKKATTDDTSRVGPLLLFSTRDVELFEQLTKIETGEILIRDYANFVRNNPRDPRGIFHFWARERFAGRQLPKGFIANKLKTLLEKLQHEQETRRVTV